MKGHDTVVDQILIDHAGVTDAMAPTPSTCRVNFPASDAVHGRVRASKLYEATGAGIMLTDLRDMAARPICRGFLKVPMIHPEAKLRLWWMFLGFLFISYEALSIPIYLAFEVRPRGVMFVVTSAVNAYFIVDILVSFCTGFWNSSGDVIMDPQKVAHRYARRWLVPDVIAAIPWEWLSL